VVIRGTVFNFVLDGIVFEIPDILLLICHTPHPNTPDPSSPLLVKERGRGVAWSIA
jgi:hypothetical protein